MQAIGNVTSSYVYSAYIDDRRTSDVSKLFTDMIPFVRVFAWVPRHVHAARPHWRCIYWRTDNQFPLEQPVIAWTDLNILEPFLPYVKCILTKSVIPQKQLTCYSCLHSLAVSKKSTKRSATA